MVLESAMRMQFYAIEIARYASINISSARRIITISRNRAGLNDWIYEKAQGKQ
jgi:hypothetical protein